jgi:hypothetical protein
MSTLEQVQRQLVELQKIVDSMKEPRLEVSRHFTGEYFKSYNGKQYRRMESQNIPIWEYFWDIKRDWVPLEKLESENMEEIYIRDCVLTPEEKPKEEIRVE